MKRNLLMTIAFVLSTFFVKAQESGAVYSQFGFIEENATAYTAVGDVNVREQPSTKAAVKTQLPIGTQVTVEKATTDTLIVNGLESVWYSVSVNDKKGYIWGGFLTSACLFNEYEEDGVRFLASIASYKEADNGTVYQIRAAQNGKELGKITIPLTTGVYQTMSLEETFAFEGTKNSLLFGVLAEACGVSDVQTLITWDGAKFTQHLSTSSVSEAGQFYDSKTMVMPTDKGGISGHVLYVEETAEMEERESNGEYYTEVKSQEYHITLYKWDGKKFVKVKTM